MSTPASHKNTMQRLNDRIIEQKEIIQALELIQAQEKIIHSMGAELEIQTTTKQRLADASPRLANNGGTPVIVKTHVDDARDLGVDVRLPLGNSVENTTFQPSSAFVGSRPGYVFRNGPHGLGYYVDDFSGAKPNSAAKSSHNRANISPVLKKQKKQKKQKKKQKKPKKNYITEIELMKKEQITSSTIENCLIKKGEEIISTNKKSYRSVLVKIWGEMTFEQIQATTKFKISKENEHGKKGLTWCADLNMSFQNKDSFGTLKEILRMIKVNKMSINLSIKFKTGRIVHFKI